MKNEGDQGFDPSSLSAELISMVMILGLTHWLSESDLDNANVYLVAVIVLSLVLSLVGFYIECRYKTNGLFGCVVSAMKVLYIAIVPAVVYGVFKIKLGFFGFMVVIFAFNVLNRLIYKFKLNCCSV